MSIFAAAGDVLGAVTSGLFNAREASKNRDFQERTASTQYQRAARDLEKAGLNRVLALGSPGAVPAGAQGVMGSFSPGTSFAQASSAFQAVDQSKAQEDLINDQAKLLTQQIRTAKTEADKNELTRGFYEALLPLADQLKAWANTNLDGDVDVEGIVERTAERAIDAMLSAGKGAGSSLYNHVESQVKSTIELLSNPSKLFELFQ